MQRRNSPFRLAPAKKLPRFANVKEKAAPEEEVGALRPGNDSTA